MKSRTLDAVNFVPRGFMARFASGGSEATEVDLLKARESDVVETLRRCAELLSEQQAMIAEGGAKGFTGASMKPDISTLGPDDRADYDELGMLAERLNIIANGFVRGEHRSAGGNRAVRRRVTAKLRTA